MNVESKGGSNNAECTSGLSVFVRLTIFSEVGEGEVETSHRKLDSGRRLLRSVVRRKRLIGALQPERKQELGRADLLFNLLDE